MASLRLLPLLHSLLVLQLHVSSQLEDNKIPPSLCTGHPGTPGTPGVHGSPGQPGRDGRDGRDAAPGEMGMKGDRGESGTIFYLFKCTQDKTCNHLICLIEKRRDRAVWYRAGPQKAKNRVVADH